MYSNIGLNYNERVIDPTVKESFKAIAARYTAEELISRPRFVIRLQVFSVVVVELSVQEFNKAIESKQTADQSYRKVGRQDT